MSRTLDLQIDRGAKLSLSVQISDGIEAAIRHGALEPGARLPSWIDLAAQLGVARGTVRTAYDRLCAAQLVVASPTNGTHVADRPPIVLPSAGKVAHGPFMDLYGEMIAGPAIFQFGVPAQGILPIKTFARLRTAALRAELSGAPLYPDPCGEMHLRREIAAYLALARGLACEPTQVLVTSGFSGGLGLVLRALALEGRRAWVEDPGFLFARHGLKLAGMSPVAVPVDAHGLDVAAAIARCSDAALAMVTPGQQAPTGVTLSLPRRLHLLDWAKQTGGWIIEDDYLGELQLVGRAAPSLASLDAERVIHIGSFSKTLGPATRIGFIVAPPPLLARCAEVAATLAPAPGPASQIALAAFMREGHYLRHLRRTKRAYGSRRDALEKALRQVNLAGRTAGLAIRLDLPEGTDDVALVRRASTYGLAPAPLSPWYVDPLQAAPGLLLGVATAPEAHLMRACERLSELIDSLHPDR